MVGPLNAACERTVVFRDDDVLILTQGFAKSLGRFTEVRLTTGIIGEEIIVCQIARIISGHFNLLRVDDQNFGVVQFGSLD